MISKALSSIVNQPIRGSDVLINGLVLDSRLVQEGNLFCATKGESIDGHLFIHQAINDGASAVAVEFEEYVENQEIPYIVSKSLKAELGVIAARFYDNPTGLMKVTGITGTNGKTSISSYVAQLLEICGEKCGLIGTLGIQYGKKNIKTNNTTPDAITLQRHFYEMTQDNIHFAAMEVSSHAIVQNRCNGVHFDTLVLSNITHDHLDYHGTFEQYMNVKLSLFARNDIRTAIVNFEESLSEKVKSVIGKSVNLISYSVNNISSDVYVTAVERGSFGFKANVHYFGKIFPLHVALLGEFNLANVLAALIVVSEQGHDLQKCVEACSQLKPVSGRMQLIKNIHNIVAVVDYAHTPDALENVLQSLRKQVSGKIITVFGCGGDRDKSKRPLMANIVEANSDYSIVTSDNPRSENLQDIIDQIVIGFDSQNFAICADRQSAIELAVSFCSANDCVLVAGKGHEKTQIIGADIIAFDDVEKLTLALQNKKGVLC